MQSDPRKRLWVLKDLQIITCYKVACNFAAERLLHKKLLKWLSAQSTMFEESRYSFEFTFLLKKLAGKQAYVVGLLCSAFVD